MTATSKTRKLYSVAYFGKNGSCYSRPVGFKMRLLDRAKAQRIVRRLKKCGVDAVANPVQIAL